MVGGGGGGTMISSENNIIHKWVAGVVMQCTVTVHYT